jgi:hypothetical protein
MTFGDRPYHRLRTVGLATIAVTLATAATGCRESARTPPAHAAYASTWPTLVTDPSHLRTSRRPTPEGGLPGLRRELLQPTQRRAASIRRWAGEPATTPWMSLNLHLVASRRTPIDPPLASRGYGLVSVAMYEAVVGADYPRHPGNLTTGSGSSHPSEHAAVAGAASRVLAYLFPERSEASFDKLAERAAASRVRTGQNSREQVEAGLTVGREVASAVVARARRDGSTGPWDGTPPPGRSHWRASAGASPVQPLAGRWRTWVLRSGSQFRPPPPPRYGSRRFLADARELLRLRRDLTPAQKRIAKFWEGGVGTPLPPGVWNEVAIAYIRRDGLTTAAAARVLALLNVAMADTGTATWDAKYRYWGPRPIGAIRALGLDRRWKPFLETPHFPGYVSAHSAYSAAASEVLGRVFPRDAGAFRAKAREAGLSRLYGGIHFRADHELGAQVGREVGQFVLHAFSKRGHAGQR